MPIQLDAQSRHTISVKLYEAPTAQGRSRARILLLKLDHIGDFITAIPAFRLMRQSFSGSEITLICLPTVVGLAESTGLFDRVAGFAAVSSSSALGNVPRMALDDQKAQFAKLLQGKYFLAVDFKYDSETRSWLDEVDAELRAGFAASTQKGLDILLPAMEWDVPTIALAGKNLPKHAETRLTLLAHTIDDVLHENALDADLFTPPQDVAEIESWRRLNSDQRVKIGLSVGAGSELRKWSQDYWGALLSKIKTAHDCVFVFFGGPGDKGETANLAAKLPQESIMDLTAAMPLAAIPAYMNLLDLYIGCDTGLTHLAGTLGVPTVNIFAGISNVSVWKTRGPRVKTVYAEVACAPCHLRQAKDCPNGNICMKAIVPDIVYACFEQLITVA